MKYAAIGIALALSMVASLAWAQPAKPKPAAEEALAKVIVLHATNEKKGIDPRIGNMPQLKKPPFSAYQGYDLLFRKELPLSTTKAGQLDLPDKRVLKVQLLKIAPPKKPGGKPTYELKTSIVKPKGKKFLSANVNVSPGEYFFVAGQAYKKGILVLGIRVLPKKK